MKRISAFTIWFFFLLATAGCNTRELEPIQGKIEFSDGSNFAFEGDKIELQLQSQKEKLAFGAINPDGTFHIESLIDGVISKGVAPGNYAARIVISDDEIAHQKEAIKAISPKYLEFETSGLQIQVPNDSEVKISLIKPTFQIANQ